MMIIGGSKCLHTEIDEIDLAIINSLMKDGRKSFRQIAREIKVSTPTVESRFSKMKNELEAPFSY